MMHIKIIQEQINDFNEGKANDLRPIEYEIYIAKRTVKVLQEQNDYLREELNILQENQRRILQKPET